MHYIIHIVIYITTPRICNFPLFAFECHWTVKKNPLLLHQSEARIQKLYHRECRSLVTLEYTPSAGIFKNNDLNFIISSLVCDQTFKQCMYAECSACADNFTEVDDKIEIDKTVKWFAWTLKDHVYNEKGNAKTSKRMVKMEKIGNIKELLDLFHAELKIFKRHVFNVRHQYQQYKLYIENLESNEAAVHIDFSENWVCKYNEEVQAMHFGASTERASKKQITLNTGVPYIKYEKPFPFCSISAENSHGPEAIWAHLHPILEHIMSAHPYINTLHFHSASQYRQKKNFFHLCKKMYELGLNST